MATPEIAIVEVSATRRIKWNIVANLAAKGSNALLLIIFVPQYIRILGVDSYGLIGIFTSLQGVFAVLDLGLSPTLNREFARFSAGKHSPDNARDLLHTLEIVSWCIAGIIVVGVAAAAPTLATGWIHARDLTGGQVSQALGLIGLAIGCQFPFTLYSGGLLGLQRQVRVSVLVVCMTVLRNFGALGVISLVTPSIDAFFVTQATLFLIQSILSAGLLWRCLPAVSRVARFCPSALARIWRFAASMAGISLLATILTQMDKVILSRFLSLAMFGFYSLASLLSFGMISVITPISIAMFPRYSQLVAIGNNDELGLLYHRSCQLLAVVVAPTAFTIILFSRQVLLLWTGNVTAAQTAQWWVSILVLGTLFNGLYNLPYTLQLSYGWPQLSLRMNLAAVIVLLPTMYLAVQAFGVMGAVLPWLLLNASYIVVGVPLMHQRLLPGERTRWYLQDFALPVGGALVGASLIRLLFLGWPLTSVARMVIPLIACLAVSSALGTVCCPAGRELLHRLRSATSLPLRSR